MRTLPAVCRRLLPAALVLSLAVGVTACGSDPSPAERRERRAWVALLARLGPDVDLVLAQWDTVADCVDAGGTADTCPIDELADRALNVGQDARVKLPDVELDLASAACVAAVDTLWMALFDFHDHLRVSGDVPDPASLAAAGALAAAFAAQRDAVMAACVTD